jgi:hypothetical protein
LLFGSIEGELSRDDGVFISSKVVLLRNVSSHRANKTRGEVVSKETCTENKCIVGGIASAKGEEAGETVGLSGRIDKG